MIEGESSGPGGDPEVHYDELMGGVRLVECLGHTPLHCHRCHGCMGPLPQNGFGRLFHVVWPWLGALVLSCGHALVCSCACHDPRCSNEPSHPTGAANGGRNWSGVEPPLSLQPRLPHGLPCVISSQVRACGQWPAALSQCSSPCLPGWGQGCGIRALGSGLYRLGHFAANGGRKHIQQHRAGLQQGNSVLEP